MGVVTHATVRKYTLAEYLRMAQAGIFAPGERLELIAGEIVRMSPHNRPHGQAISHSSTAFSRLLGDTHAVRVQQPLTLSEDSEPLPDFALVTHQVLSEALAGDRHPGKADLVMEVADSSLAYDRSEKASLYAYWRVPEYWLLDVRRGRLLVHRQPEEDVTAPFLHSYARLEPILVDQLVSPLCRPDCALRLEDLL